MGNQAALAWSLLGLGEIAAAQGHITEAEQHYHQALMLQQVIQDMDHAGTTAVEGALQKEQLLLKPLLNALDNRTRATLYDQLGETVFTSAWTKGAAMTLAQAVEYALAG